MQLDISVCASVCSGHLELLWLQKSVVDVQWFLSKRFSEICLLVYEIFCQHRHVNITTFTVSHNRKVIEDVFP